MPTETVVVILAVTAFFTFFSVALEWTSRHYR